VNRIIFVPGKNPKPPPEQHRQQLLRCLLHGIRRIDPQIVADIERQDCFTLIPWNRLMYAEDRPIEVEIPWVDRLLEQPLHTHAIDSARPLAWHLARAMYLTGDYLPWMIPLLPDPRIKLSIRETEIYFSNRDNVGCRIRDLQKRPLRAAAGNGERVLLIGHSMGSVIAWDALWELDHLEGLQDCVDCLLTIGSPLGMNYVQHRLLGFSAGKPRIFPRNIRRWVNIAAQGDLVALDPVLADDFSAMVTRRDIDSITDLYKGVYNHYRDEDGLNVHKSYGYLVNPRVANVIADWWRAP